MDQHEAEILRVEEAFDEESRKLADVTQFIREEQGRLEAQMPATADHQQTANEIQQILETQSDSFWAALEQPYFGRLDYYHRREGDPEPGSEESGDAVAPLRTIYLGGTHILGKDVFSWTAPVGKLWYTQSYEDGYTAPRGYIATRVDLKRHLRIRVGHLEDVNDLFRRMLPAADSARLDLLAGHLSGTGPDDGQLTIIIETIEPEQYESIANVNDTVVIVQGSAGSGKSEIGLHRIAYLLSPFSDIAERERPTPDTTLLVGPSQAFLENADDVLPGLGVAAGVHRVRFSEWLGNKLSDRRVHFSPGIWNNLLNRGEVRDFDEKAETFKGSLAMADAMDRHVAELAARIRQSCRELGPVLGPDSRVRVTRDQVRVTLGEVLPRRSVQLFLNRQREEFIRRISGLIEEGGPVGNRARRAGAWLRSIGRDALDRERRERNELESRRRLIRNAVVDWCESAWPSIDFRQEYTELLSNSENMARLAGDRLSSEDAEALAVSISRNSINVFGDADMGALAYLDHLLNGTIESRFRHIVVDEAQDISPIEFKLLSISSSNNWFTILGDTAQRLTPYRGIERWRDVDRVFGRSEIAVQRARRSYRSTKQITVFTNRILRTFDKNIDAPIPFEREGARVEYSRHANGDAMYQSVIDDIDRIRSMDHLADAVIAILARDTLNLNRFKGYCGENGVDGIMEIGTAHPDGLRTILARIPDVKGLEYDGVLVMGVNDSFSDTLFNKKLLYLATTRAKHYLGIHWSGRRSPILDAVSELGVTQYRR